MHTTDISIWKHNHDFSGDTSSAEKRTRIVTGFAATMMIVEIIAGYYFNSMALIADGWHMGTHVAAFVLAASAYAFARRHAMDAMAKPLHAGRAAEAGVRHGQSGCFGRFCQRDCFIHHCPAHGRTIHSPLVRAASDSFS